MYLGHQVAYAFPQHSPMWIEGIQCSHAVHVGEHELRLLVPMLMDDSYSLLPFLSVTGVDPNDVLGSYHIHFSHRMSKKCALNVFECSFQLGCGDDHVEVQVELSCCCS